MEELERYWTRMRATDDETLPGLLVRLLSKPTQEIVMAELAPAITVAKGEYESEVYVIINKSADKLDIDDPMRTAIEGVSDE